MSAIDRRLLETAEAVGKRSAGGCDCCAPHYPYVVAAVLRELSTSVSIGPGQTAWLLRTADRIENYE